MENLLNLIELASRDLVSAGKHMEEIKKHEFTSEVTVKKLRGLGLEYLSTSTMLRAKKEIFITTLCESAYYILGTKKYTLKRRESGVETITLSSGDCLCIHLVSHPRNRCIVDYPNHLTKDEFNEAFLFFCHHLINDVKTFLHTRMAVQRQSEGLSRLIEQVAELNPSETSH